MAKLNSLSQQKLLQHYTTIRDWFNQGSGRKLLTLEKPFLDKALSYCFGRFLLEVGPIAEFTKPVKDIKMIVKLGCAQTNADIIVEEAAWPILTEGAEVIVLQHALDFACSPHDLLRESARCVRPGGHLIIVGINPYSGWGIFRRCHMGALGKSHSVTKARLSDWLRLLGFTIEQYWTGGYCLPTRAHSEDKLTLLEATGQRYRLWGNGFYVISARKMMLQSTALVNENGSILGKLAAVPVVGRNDVEAYEQDS